MVVSEDCDTESSSTSLGSEDTKECFLKKGEKKRRETTEIRGEKMFQAEDKRPQLERIYCIQRTKTISIRLRKEVKVRNKAEKRCRSQNKKKLVRHTKEFRCHRELKGVRWLELR